MFHCRVVMLCAAVFNCANNPCLYWTGDQAAAMSRKKSAPNHISLPCCWFDPLAGRSAFRPGTGSQIIDSAQIEATFNFPPVGSLKDPHHRRIHRDLNFTFRTKKRENGWICSRVILLNRPIFTGNYPTQYGTTMAFTARAWRATPMLNYTYTYLQIFPS